MTTTGNFRNEEKGGDCRELKEWQPLAMKEKTVARQRRDDHSQ